MSQPDASNLAANTATVAEPEPVPSAAPHEPTRTGFNPPLIAGLVVASLLAWLIGWAALSPPPPAAEPEKARIVVEISLAVAPAPPATEAKPAPEPKPAAEAKPAAPAPPTPAAPLPLVAPATPPERTAVAVAPAPRAPPAALRTVPGEARKAWQVHGRPFANTEGKPVIVVVMTSLGLAANATRSAIELPGEITLAFVPYARRLDEWVALARAAGHEVLVDMPMEPQNFPAQDPGPQALLTSLSAGENIGRLEWALGRAVGFVGVVNHMGSKFTESPNHLTPVLESLRDRGLIFLDSRSSTASVAARVATAVTVPRVINDRFIDNEASRDAIDEQLATLEAVARRSEVAVGMARPYPVTIERLSAWLKTLPAKGFAVAPITAVLDRQADR
ncbi:MAG: divergent polysaccharide deacetylase family protein [Alphaproteobacteria bacterium]|nr:divergent polysaccharide deacetylase family protein [Alphaproteobacteria bacterium]